MKTVKKLPSGTREQRESQSVKRQRRAITKQTKQIKTQTDKIIQELFNWEEKAMDASQDSIKDELWTVLFIGLIIACFVPSLQPYISDGFRFLREDCPDWLSYGILASIAASFGLKSIGKFKK